MPTSHEAIMGWRVWTDEYFVSTVGNHGNETMVGEYVNNPRQGYKIYIRVTIDTTLDVALNNSVRLWRGSL